MLVGRCINNNAIMAPAIEFYQENFIFQKNDSKKTIETQQDQDEVNDHVEPLISNAEAEVEHNEEQSRRRESETVHAREQQV